MTELKRLVSNFRTAELVMRCLYRTEGEAGPNTKARRREENRAAWCDYFECLAGSLRARAEEYDQRAQTLMEGEPKGDGFRPSEARSGVRYR